jgi:hypothetical protein
MYLESGGGFLCGICLLHSKLKVVLWIDLEEKILTWDNKLKRGWIGVNYCALCSSEAESMTHMFHSLYFSFKIPQMVSDHFKIPANIQGECL